MTVHAFDPDRRTNARLMADCARLGYLDGVVLDLTYGKGAFWTEYRPETLVTNDLDPATGADYCENFTRSTFATHAEFDTVVFDPPYRMGGTPSTPTFDAAYGLTVWRGVDEIRALMSMGAWEACRIARRLALIKCQDSVNGGRVRMQTVWMADAVDRVGCRVVDSLHVVGGRAQPKGRAQTRARHGYSTLLVIDTTRFKTELPDSVRHRPTLG